MQDSPKLSSLATSPLYSLLDKDTSQMTRDELTKFVNHLRTLRTSPPTFAKQLREDEEIADETLSEKPKKPTATRAKALNVDNFLASLEARAASKTTPA